MEAYTLLKTTVNLTMPQSRIATLIGDLIDNLMNAKVFFKMDVQWGYNNIHIKEGDKWKAAFRTNLRLFKPTVMFFGLTNSPATFQNFMNHIFKTLIYCGKVAIYIYMDDILVFTKHTNNMNK